MGRKQGLCGKSQCPYWQDSACDGGLPPCARRALAENTRLKRLIVAAQEVNCDAEGHGTYPTAKAIKAIREMSSIAASIAAKRGR